MRHIKDKLKLRDKLKESSFSKTLKSIREHADRFSLIVLLDIFTVWLLMFLGREAIDYALVKAKENPAILFSYIAIYLLIAIIIYSFLKYCLMILTKQIFSMAKLNIRRIPGFLMLNMLIFLIISAVFIILQLITISTMKEAFIRTGSAVIFLIFTLLAYAFINIAHSLFIEGKDKVIRKSASFFSKLHKYLPVYAALFMIFLIFILFSFVTGLLAKLLNVNYGLYKTILSILAIIIYSVLVSFGRTNLYFIVKKGAA